MAGYFERTVTLFCVAVVFYCAFITTTEATYRKPPFNGSIFGKRAGSNNGKKKWIVFNYNGFTLIFLKSFLFPCLVSVCFFFHYLSLYEFIFVFMVVSTTTLFIFSEYDSASKALSAMCEIANEACQSWFPITQEKWDDFSIAFWTRPRQ